ncbi:hypothetical protein AVEN_237324-1 [Araneus ventricosus]|uniref:Uncharacterized protein n=1 Tax=Araneus ventricosus TaxID=182803 RepID=A0A4Y2IDW0_ARAVE|nr:hypothetical protein AVEN_237324-1 [Araneus ventricosus]
MRSRQINNLVLTSLMDIAIVGSRFSPPMIVRTSIGKGRAVAVMATRTPASVIELSQRLSFRNSGCQCRAGVTVKVLKHEYLYMQTMMLFSWVNLEFSPILHSFVSVQPLYNIHTQVVYGALFPIDDQLILLYY